MGIILGHITSKTTSKSYNVKLESHQSWIQVAPNVWQAACKNVSEIDVLKCTQEYIDSQPDIY
jgi:hypothetical protein